jgi:solute carrier family 12 sodium/potassium/chloride transporter 2
MAGVSMSGDLKDARRSLPLGTLYAIGAGFIIYMGLALLLGMNFSVQTLAADTSPAKGIQNYVLFDNALAKPLVFLGLWGATLSSAVGSILAAPRTLQALAVDGAAPRFLAKGSGPTNEPVIGLWVTFGLAVLGVTLGSLDAIAQVLTIFFLATYGITNLACGLEIWAANPSFRPTFRISAWVPLFGAGACFYVMSIINLAATAAAGCICLIIYTIVQRRSLNTTFGDARHGLWSALVRTALKRLHQSDYHDQNWRPNLLIFGGSTERRNYLLEMGGSVVQEQGITSYIQMLQGSVEELAPVRREKQVALNQAQGDYPNVFFRVDIVPDVYRGIVTTAQSYGIGSLAANTVMLGWPKKSERADRYFATLRELVQLENTLMIVNYDEERRYGERKEIHIWWRGLQANGGIMLLLAYLITADLRWRGAKVKVLTVVQSEDDKLVAQAGLARVFESARLNAEPVVLMSNGLPVNDLMAQYSRHADLAILGLRLPNKEDDAKQLFEHYNSLLTSLPSTVLVHSGGAFKAAPVLFDNDS